MSKSVTHLLFLLTIQLRMISAQRAVAIERLISIVNALTSFHFSFLAVGHRLFAFRRDVSPKSHDVNDESHAEKLLRPNLSRDCDICTRFWPRPDPDVCLRQTYFSSFFNYL